MVHLSGVLVDSLFVCVDRKHFRLLVGGYMYCEARSCFLLSSGLVMISNFVDD